MRETIFKFKQFTVKNKNSAMKVGTDGVLIGAWTTASDQCIDILDIGAGTGLVSLMMAQRNPNANIIGVEIDENSYVEACDNVSNSPWKDRVDVIMDDFNSFAELSNLKYDVILSNPPFFDNGIT